MKNACIEAIRLSKLIASAFALEQCEEGHCVYTYDLAIRGRGTVATASDTFKADIGIRGGRIAAVAETIEGATDETTSPVSSCCPAASTATFISRSPPGPTS